MPASLDLKIALDNNLTILGTSDIHGLIDWDYDLAGGGHRTATLVLAASETSDGVKAALKAGDTVAIYNDNLIGKKTNVEAVVRSTLKMEVDEALPKTTVQGVSIINESPVDYVLENVGAEGAYDEGHVFTVKSGSTFTLLIPVFSAIMAWVFLGEAVSAGQAAAMVALPFHLQHTLGLGPLPALLTKTR